MKSVLFLIIIFLFNPSSKNIDELSSQYLMGKFEPSHDSRFVLISQEHLKRKMTIYMREEAYNAFIEMSNSAKKDGVDLKILSATRTFHNQKGIWEQKWNGERAVDGKFLKNPKIPPPIERAKLIMQWSAMPGTSRHHWGTDIDLNELSNTYFETGEGKKVYNWLVNNAHHFEFCQVYTMKGEKRMYGYEEEKWHWSYKPLAQKFLTAYKTKITNKDIAGFSGAETADTLKILQHYVLGVDSTCF